MRRTRFRFLAFVFAGLLVIAGSLLVMIFRQGTRQTPPATATIPSRPTITISVSPSAAVSPSVSEAVGGQRLPFDLVEAADRGIGGWLYASPEPGLSVITTRDELGELPAAISAEAEQQLISIDFGTYFVVAAFQGYQSTDGYGIDIEHVERRNTSVILYSRLTVPKPGQELHLIVTSPYAIVRVEKVGSFGKVFDFVLNVGGEAVVSASHFVP